MGKLIDALQQKNEREGDRHDMADIKEQVLRGDTKRLNCDVPLQVYKKLQIKAIQEDQSITAVVNRLVYEYVHSS